MWFKNIILVVAIGCVSFLGFQVHDYLSGDQPASKRSNAEKQQMKDQLAQLKSGMEEMVSNRKMDKDFIATLEARLRQSEAALQAVQASKPNMAEVKQAEASTDDTPVELTREQMLKHMGDHFILEELDQEWANGIQSLFEESFAQYSEQGHQLQSFECRSTLCKMEVVSGNGDSGLAIREVLSDKGFGQIEGYWTKEHDVSGQEKMIMYFTRDGYRLPEQGVERG